MITLSSSSLARMAGGVGDLERSESPPVDIGSGEDNDLLRTLAELTILPLPLGAKELFKPCGLAVTQILPALTEGLVSKASPKKQKKSQCRLEKC